MDRPTPKAIRFKAALRWLVRLRRSPRAIAGGFALGAFLALTPTFGVQIPLVLVLATLLNLNRPAAFATVWITNLATFAPLYTFNYWIGSFLWSGPSAAEVYGALQEVAGRLVKVGVLEIREQIKILMEIGRDIFIPLWIGSIIVGTIVAFLIYVLSMVMLRYLISRRNRKRVLH